MIKKLTKEQEDSVIPYREKWRKIGLSTERADKEAAIEAITGLYEKMDKKKPIFIFCPSPLFCIYQINFLKFLGKKETLQQNLWENLGRNLGENLRENLQLNLRGNLWQNLWENLGENLELNLGQNLWQNLRQNLWQNLWQNLRQNLELNLWQNLGQNLELNLELNLGENLRQNLGRNLRQNLERNLERNLELNLEQNLGQNLGQNLWQNLRQNLWQNLERNLRQNLEQNLWENLRGNLWENLRENLKDEQFSKELTEFHNFWGYGQMDSSWICFYTFMETIGIKYKKEDSKLLGLWAKTAKSCSWFWTFENFVFVSDRPKKLSFNKDYRLHDEHGAAYQYTDGWSGYYLNGVHFPKELYLKIISREMEMKDILAIQDIDQRTQAMKFAKNGLRDFYREQKGEMIDHYVKMDVEGTPINYELWKIPKGSVFNKTVHFAIYDCPSSIKTGKKKEYAKGVPEFKTVAEAMAWGCSSDENILSSTDWKSLIPLVQES